MFQTKKPIRGTLSLRNYNVQIGDISVMMKGLNKLTELGMLKMKVSI
ncbi:hypothetical protein [Candidatus Enterovibrio altilux]|uniref:Mobile element protein n=1 Tax=Candidatus Enterovibrio altilux TaxID=1927128 RepID=A0A291B8C7_9GAMM|nr:hypothetical protein [Candidatus Enterovibrio luxaltus]ATF09246.1 hypothetical protein BTN50_0732 [Candidatus Enterovibrio luxaltus]